MGLNLQATMQPTSFVRERLFSMFGVSESILEETERHHQILEDAKLQTMWHLLESSAGHVLPAALRGQTHRTASQDAWVSEYIPKVFAVCAGTALLKAYCCPDRLHMLRVSVVGSHAGV
jgi:hypothetical protein